jgi:acyl-CoA thioester hydrolase
VDTAIPKEMTDRARYRHWVPEVVRFADLDVLGHANNKSVMTYIESGRVALLRQMFGEIWTGDKPPVAVHMAVDFLAEIHWPNALEVGNAVLRQGNSSFELATAVFIGARCYAAARSTLVRIDKVTRRPVSLGDAERAELTRWAL